VKDASTQSTHVSTAIYRISHTNGVFIL